MTGTTMAELVNSGKQGACAQSSHYREVGLYSDIHLLYQFSLVIWDDRVGL